jgi:hypothetical protein
MSDTPFPLLRHLGLAAVGAVTLLAGLACPPSVSTGGACTYDGQSYDAGETFPATDGCNSCFCDESGSVGCTEKGCATFCEWNGQVYEAGDEFPAGDGCNSCSCDVSGEVACTLIGCPAGQCSHEGYFHSPGEGWESFDQCEACMCQEDGQAICSDNGPCTTCYYAGVLYSSGETFPALDGCNACTCNDGSFACTEAECACDPAQEWWRSYVGNPDECTAGIDFDCAPNAMPFYNECGCGCEQPAWCPPVFDCQPPTPCDVDSIAALCPNSQIAL